ncbi:MAG: AbrB family transcriptional regulator [Gammaproteobacteria bacterium]|nr:AbrB family transcriptional regulator [Gammaproteobacteria bacterium]MDH3413436.1 AbrB family transcriptional regulator [Gammaproteobacteria bacterium]
MTDIKTEPPKQAGSLKLPPLRLYKTLAIGAVGGSIFFYFRMPLAWMLGAMVICTIASLSGVKLQVSGMLRSVMVTVLGVMLGSTFTSEVIEKASEWPVTILSLVLYIVVLTGLLYFYFTKFQKFDPVTAYFSATPGGLNEMVIAGGTMGGDERTIALVHGARVLLVVMVIPFWFRYTEGERAITTAVGPSIASTSLIDIGILVTCGVIGLLFGRLVRLPAYKIVGPMLVSAGVHIAGLTSSAPPWEIVAIAQVVVGSSVGARFSGIPLERVLKTMAASVGATAVMLATTVLFALVLSHITGLAVAPIVLAFSPGGLAEMSLIALSLGIETAFVATHHVSRIAMIVIAAPLVFKALGVKVKKNE